MDRKHISRWVRWLGSLAAALVFGAGCIFPVDFAADIQSASTQTRAPTNTRRPTSTSKPTLTPTPTTYYRPVTWMELVDFITDDHTNWNDYDAVDYNCLDYAVDLVENAHEQNLKAWVVGVDFVDEETGHAFVAFETSDRGIVYVEPQGDNTYLVLEVGKPLCDAWGMYECFGVVESFEYVQCDHDGYCTPYSP